jgi:N-glycosylase/DNA lyase
MAKFKKGESGNPNGRPKGALNRSTEQMKLTIARAVNNSLNSLQEDLERIRKEDPEKAIQLSTKLLEYTLPKMKSIDMNATMDINHRIDEITININRSGSNEN